MAICSASHNFVGLHLLQLRHVSTTRKSVSNSNTSSTCPHIMVIFRLLTAEIGSGVLGTPANFHGFQVLASLLQRRLNEGQPNFAWCLAVSWADTLYILFWRLLPPNGILQVQNLLCVQVMCYPILAALLHGTRAVGISQTLCRGIFMRQGGHAVRHWAVELSSLS